MRRFTNQDKSPRSIYPFFHMVSLDIFGPQGIRNERQHAAYSGERTRPSQSRFLAPQRKLYANLGSQYVIIHESIASTTSQPSSTSPRHLLSGQNTWTAYSLPWR